MTVPSSFGAFFQPLAGSRASSTLGSVILGLCDFSRFFEPIPQIAGLIQDGQRPWWKSTAAGSGDGHLGVNTLVPFLGHAEFNIGILVADIVRQL